MTDADRCQGPTVGGEPARPWAGTPRAADHDAIERILGETPYEWPISRLAEVVFDPEVEPGDADWQFTKRHCERYHRTFRPTGKVAVPVAPDEYENRQTEPDLLWVEPTTTTAESVLDTASKHSPESGGGSIAAANARGICSRRRVLATAAEWGDLLGAYGAKRLGAERAPSGVRTEARWNDEGRALNGRERVEESFGLALDSHTDAVLVTVTTAPSRYESLLAASEGLVDDVSLLRQKIGYALPGDAPVPPSVTAPEPTADGKPHAHVAIFGPDVDAMPSRHDLQTYWWECRERGQQVHLAGIEVRDGAWAWADDPPADATEGCPPAAYLRQGADALVTAAATPAEDVLAVAGAYRDLGDREIADGVDAAVAAAVDAAGPADPKALRAAAWYWATGLPAVTRSPSLRGKESDRTNSKPI